MKNAIIRIDENGAVRCGNCSHRLFNTNIDSNRETQVKKLLDRFFTEIDFEIKCHSCKAINRAEVINDD